MAKDFIEELHSLVQSQYSLSDNEFNLRAKGILLKALDELARLENALADKDASQKKYTEERKHLLHKLNKAMEGETNAYERLADIDVSRHAEVSDLRMEAANLKNENNSLLAEIKRLEDFRTDDEVQKLVVSETRGNLDNALKNLKDLESKHKELEEEYKALEIENTSLKDILVPVPDTQAEEPDSAEKLNAISDEIAELRASLGKSADENISLRETVSSLNAVLENKDSEFKEIIAAETKKYEQALSLKDAELSEIKARVNDIQSERNGLDLKTGGIEKENDTLKQEKTALLDEISSLRLKLEEDSKNLATLADERIGLMAKIDELTAEKTKKETAAEKKFSEIESELAKLKSQSGAQESRMLAEMESVKKEASHLKSELEQSAVILRQRQNDIDRVTREKTELSSVLSETQRKLGNAEDELISLRKEKAELSAAPAKEAERLPEEIQKVIEKVVSEKLARAVPEKQNEPINAYVYKNQGFDIKKAAAFFAIILALLLILGIFLFRDRLLPLIK